MGKGHVLYDSGIVKMDWAIWKPYSTDSAKGNGTYPLATIGMASKIVLDLAPYTTAPAAWAKPPHFSISLEAEGRAWQHVSMTAPAWSLGSGTYNSINYSENRDCGRTIQIAILSPELLMMSKYRTDNKGWWVDARIQRLAWHLQTICETDLISVGSDGFRVPVKVPFAFDGTNAMPNLYRVTFPTWQKAWGIMGTLHGPFDTNKWAPGQLNTNKLMDAMRGSLDLKDTPASATAEGTPAADILVEEEDAAAEAAGENSPTEEFSMEGKAFKFNPPLHKSAKFVRTDFTSSDHIMDELAVWYDEPSTYGLGAEGVKGLTSLRIGRIIQHEMSAGLAALNPFRYGFRFHYNPASVSTVASRNDSVYIDPGSVHDSIVSGINQNFQVINLALLLNRQPDVLSASYLKGTDYSPNIDAADLEGIKTFGTHWDLRYLYLMCNGEWDLEDRGKSPDLGVLIPASARLILGQLNLFGFVERLDHKDVMFSKDMVPIITEVNLVYRRHVDINDPAAFATLVGGTTTPNDASIYSSSAEVDVNETPGSTGKADAVKGNNKQAPCPGYNHVTVKWGLKNTNNWSIRHSGVDYGEAPEGAKVIATRTGQVIFSGWNNTFGNMVTIQTEDVQHMYCHLKTITVQSGPTVLAGDQVGTVGGTGSGAKGVHLHYEERQGAPYKYGVNDRDPVWNVRT